MKLYICSENAWKRQSPDSLPAAGPLTEIIVAMKSNRLKNALISMIRCVGLRKFGEQQKVAMIVATPMRDNADAVRPAMDRC